MKQCQLQQGNEIIKGWIPDKGANLGARVELKGRNGLWKVTEVYGFHMTDSQLTQQQKLQRGWHNNI